MKPRFFLPLLCAFLATVPARAQITESWNNMSAKPSVLALQREGIATRAVDTTAPLTSSALSGIPSGTGLRLRALLTAPATGTYTLSISGAHAASLYVSPGDSRFEKQRVAWLYEATNAQQWNKFPSQTSASVVLTANTSYYLEAQVMSSAAGGHLALGWKIPGSTATELIPVSALSALPADANDLDDNGLPDTWQAATDLDSSTIANALRETADPDNDGLSNFDEYQLDSDPLAQEQRADGLTRDAWFGTSGGLVSNLTLFHRTRFLSHPSETIHVPHIDDPALGSNVGYRYRGFLVAPVTGNYRLWIAGNDKCELWFADGTVRHPDTNAPLTNRHGKQLLAHNQSPTDSFPSAYQGFDRLTSQRSRVVHLVEGQSYYIEVLHKKGGGTPSHVSVAWQVPGQAPSFPPPP